MSRTRNRARLGLVAVGVAAGAAGILTQPTVEEETAARVEVVVQGAVVTEEEMIRETRRQYCHEQCRARGDEVTDDDGYCGEVSGRTCRCSDGTTWDLP